MKAINLDQPWATLVMMGRKTIELRGKRPGVTGVVAIRATKKVHKALARGFELDPETLPVNGVIGTVRITGVVEMTFEVWQARRQEHLSPLPYPPSQFRWGWELADPVPLGELVYVRSMPGVFALPDEINAVLLAARA